MDHRFSQMANLKKYADDSSFVADFAKSKGEQSAGIQLPSHRHVDHPEPDTFFDVQ